MPQGFLLDAEQLRCNLHKGGQIVQLCSCINEITNPLFRLMCVHGIDAVASLYILVDTSSAVGDRLSHIKGVSFGETYALADSV